MAISNQERTTSNLHVYSIGTAAENKERNTMYLEVYPQEQLPMADGPLNAGVNKYKAASQDADGIAYEEEQQVTATIKAKWRPFGGSRNRMTPPFVRRGEQVILFQFGDTDEYFWDEYDTNIGGRKLDGCDWAFSAHRDENQTELTPENSYTFGVSAHDGRVGFQTTDQNGEVTKYTTNFDTKNGVIDIKDSAGNGYMMNTKDNHIKVYNGAGSFFEVIGDTVNIKCKTLNIDCDTINETTSNINTKGEISQEGNTMHKGNLELNGGLTTTGGGGDGIFSGGIHTTKDVIAGETSVQHHTHMGVHGKTSEPNK